MTIYRIRNQLQLMVCSGKIGFLNVGLRLDGLSAIFEWYASLLAFLVSTFLFLNHVYR